MADFSVVDEGSIVALTPLTTAAQEWLDENVEAEPWQYLGKALCVDHRCAEALLRGAVDAGFHLTVG